MPRHDSSPLDLVIDGLGSEESGEYAYSVEVVGHSGGFTSRVHSPDGTSHVNTLERNLRSQNVAECGASCHVAVVDEILAFHSCLVA